MGYTFIFLRLSFNLYTLQSELRPLSLVRSRACVTTGGFHACTYVRRALRGSCASSRARAGVLPQMQIKWDYLKRQ
jgi:hypothetical protein